MVGRPSIDPLRLARVLEPKVSRRRGGVVERKYYRFRAARWYGGIVTGDVVGCNLRCVYCWGSRVRGADAPNSRFYSPEAAFKVMDRIARRRGLRLMRLSGAEPTIAWEHTRELIRMACEEGYTFVLETNGILLGVDKGMVRDVASIEGVVVRVSIKAATPETFEILTLAPKEYFWVQLNALRSMVEEGMEPGEDFYPAVMLSFNTDEEIRWLVERLAEIHPALPEEIDPEYVILYPHVVKSLKAHGVKPRRAFTPDNVPVEMI